MWPSAASLQGLSCSTVMLGYVSAQFVLWALHDALQQLMFTQPGFAPFGTTMVRAQLHARVVTAPWTCLLPSGASPFGKPVSNA